MMFASAAIGGAVLASGMIAAAEGIGTAVGTAIREARNEKRLNQWHKAVIAKSDEAEDLLAEFNVLRRDSLGPYPYLTQRAVDFYQAFKQEHAAAFERQTLYDAYDDLASLVDRIRYEIANFRDVARKVFNERARRQAAELIRKAEEAA